VNDKVEFSKFIRDMALDMARGQAHAMQVGCKVTEQRYGRSIKAVRAAYEAALLDPQSKLPTVLTASILALLALHEQDQINLYANAMVERDKQPQWERDMRQGAKETDARHT
jgi:hypothetical protein